MSTNAVNNSPLSDLHALTKDIADLKGVHHDMQFQIGNLEPLSFGLNPQEYQRISEPVETELPTATSWYTFRWQLKPAQHIIQVYCGFQGRSVDAIMSALEGLIDVLWIWPYLSISTHVKIMTVTRMRSSQTPYGAKYQIVMRELAPTIRYLQGQITQFRINDSFLSPQVYTPTDIGISKTDNVPVHSNWTSLADGALFVSQSIPASKLSMVQQYDAMIKLNQNLQSYDGWAPGQPKDTSGNFLNPNSLRYAIGT